MKPDGISTSRRDNTPESFRTYVAIHEFVINGKSVGAMTPDFEYIVTATGEVATEDAKSGPTRTEAAQAAVAAIHQIEITEV